jgi:hypothetical protein
MRWPGETRSDFRNLIKKKKDKRGQKTLVGRRNRQRDEDFPSNETPQKLAKNALRATRLSSTKRSTWS